MTQEEINKKLVRAVMFGNEQEVEQALGDGADLFILDEKGNTLLTSAAYKRNFETFDYLLEISKDNKKINLNHINHNGQTTLMAMIESEADMRFVEKLIKAGADVNSFTDVNMPPLMHAISQENFDLFNLLIDNGADVNIRLKETLNTPLLFLGTAATTNKIHKMAQKLIEAGADINAQDRNGRTVLMNMKLRSKRFMHESELKSLKSTEQYIIENPNLNIKIKDYSGADMLFHYMSDGEFDDGARKLIELGAPIDTWNNHYINRNIKTSTAHLIMNSIVNESHLISQKTKEKELQEKKAALTKSQNNNVSSNTNNQGQLGKHEKERTIDDLYSELMDMLNKYNIDLTEKNTMGNSIASIAMSASKDFVKLWLADNHPIADALFFVDRKTGNEKERSVLDIWVSQPSETEIVEELLKRGVGKSYEGAFDDIIDDQEPLFTAITTLNVNAVSLLLNYGVNPNVQLRVNKNADYYTPLSVFASGILDGNYNKAISELHQQKRMKKGYEENIINGVENTIMDEDTYKKVCENIEKLEKVAEQVDDHRLQILNELISFGADVNLIDKNNKTPIFYVNDEKTYGLLTQMGADIFAKNGNDEDYLTYLLTNTQKSKIISLVYEEYKKFNHPLGVRPLYELAFNEKVIDSYALTTNAVGNMFEILSTEEKEAIMHNRKVEHLKDNLSRITSRLENQKAGAQYGVNEKMIQQLEKDKETINNKLVELGDKKEVKAKEAQYIDGDGNNILIIAAAMNNPEFLKFFIEIGADVNHENNLGETAIMHAIGAGNWKMVSNLIEAGADVTKVNKEGKSVLNLAEDLDNDDILELIMRKIDPTIEEGEISRKRTFRY